MGKQKDDNSWNYSGVKRRDFQHTHDGPEEMPHKKKSKKAGRKKSRCEHSYKVIEERTWAYRAGHAQRMIVLHCKKCGKKQYEITYIHEEW